MKILHLCLSNFYIDEYNYQENVLPRVNKEDGHDVMIIASTETFVENSKIGYVEPAEYVTEYGVPIKRIPYKRICNAFSTHKLRFYKGLYEEILKFNPDVIMSHDLAFGSICDVIKYLKKHKNVKFYADTHTAAYNSGMNWLSLHVLHRMFYKHCVRKAYPYLEKYFYIGESEKEFNIKNYGIESYKMEYFPLGGTIINIEEYNEKRMIRRKELNVADEELLIIHSGKLNKQKKTIDLLRAFEEVPKLKAKLVIIGQIPDYLKNEFFNFVENDNRVVYLGWKTGSELQEYLCAGDLYAQPGSVSATAQNAICHKNIVMLYPHKDYVVNYDYGNILWVENVNDMVEIFKNFEHNKYDIDKMLKGSEYCAESILNYKKLAAKLYL